MNNLSSKTIKVMLATVITLFLSLVGLIAYLHEKEDRKITKILPDLSNGEDNNAKDKIATKLNSSSNRDISLEKKLSIELVPEEEALRRDDTLNQERIDSINDLDIKRPEIRNRKFHSTFGRRVVFIYFSHTRESFLPYFKKGTAPASAYHSQVNVSLVGKRVGSSLKHNGIWNQVSNIDITNMLNNRNLNFGSSYQMSREIVLQEMRENRDLEMTFDIHRDSLPRELSTIIINGESMAKISFVIGNAHENYKKNLNFTREIHDLIEKRYPGLSRGIIIKNKSQGNGVYNQDLLPNSVIVEIGGVDNTLEELYRSADVLGYAISEYYWDKEHD
ncbi:stage II sporulation protein P [Metabacillus halosaccharovorans]|uniref:stage II sporulation protein P n=1 Tax=Metabacillus halosaccharovorans TaxID=930124 RepID=UPI000C7FC800|nr:stage II sporulation protein P [Metabacillus halosaccharovorans]MBU7595658.1 stage II sporulation protein P [Metabacillus halosaccharovorans]MCM3441513.1 stage II sporulation protein P [Metabacillus halosaccharovorans]PMC36357.1 stage II sporulation protein P [Bacillus sp. UMB0899]